MNKILLTLNTFMISTILSQSVISCSSNNNKTSVLEETNNITNEQIINNKLNKVKINESMTGIESFNYLNDSIYYDLNKDVKSSLKINLIYKEQDLTLKEEINKDDQTIKYIKLLIKFNNKIPYDSNGDWLIEFSYLINDKQITKVVNIN